MRSAGRSLVVTDSQPGVTVDAGEERIQDPLSVDPTRERQRRERVVAVQPILIEALVDEREMRDITVAASGNPSRRGYAHRRESTDPAK